MRETRHRTNRFGRPTEKKRKVKELNSWRMKETGWMCTECGEKIKTRQSPVHNKKRLHVVLAAVEGWIRAGNTRPILLLPYASPYALAVPGLFGVLSRKRSCWPVLPPSRRHHERTASANNAETYTQLLVYSNSLPRKKSFHSSSFFFFFFYSLSHLHLYIPRDILWDG